VYLGDLEDRGLLGSHECLGSHGSQGRQEDLFCRMGSHK
jgi:hypothetical protein